ncbi:FHA domain-containing protein FhaA [Botrimarina colliarenosi]|uniref:FHA domain-containing protein FhaA n=1 Tax=Botrimarina colliarenosi TaxID=2528001 RepID=A0A5C6AM39_9BACT|nr:FHA domain-containing protein [Botrimarina colliarenosi]TWU00186.1 FHA domain-containing protein FhaA [Botrimarina colliarenosi]
MARVTLQVLDGADRGAVFDRTETPLTIGREEGNTIQLNDERISRFHVKIQEDQGKVVLTDLESTNGTRVNGLDTQLRILQVGDLIAVGRSTLLYGARDEIAARVEMLRAMGARAPSDSMVDKATGPVEEREPNLNDSANLVDLQWGADSLGFPGTLHLPGPPGLPEGMTPAQAAQVAEMLEYFHTRTRALLHNAIAPNGDRPVAIERERWHELVDLQAQLAQYLRRIGDAT